jgi:hypothetical protein
MKASSLDECIRDAMPGLFAEVLDDYYDDAAEVREFAFTCTFEPPFTGSWKGLHSLERDPRTQATFHDLGARIPARGTPNWEEIEQSYRFWGRPSAGVFALLLDGQQDTPHAHKRTGRWAGVCYLSAPELCDGREGLRFFRHRPTGATSCAGASSAQLEVYRQDALDASKWEVLGSVAMRCNRMVLFDGQYFHAASSGFGHDARTGRLTQLFAIDLVDEQH